MNGLFPVLGVESSLTQQIEGVCFECECLRNHPPGSVVAGLKLVEAGFSGVRGLRVGLVEEGSRGTVGKPEGKGDTSTPDKNIWSKYTMFERA